MSGADIVVAYIKDNNDHVLYDMHGIVGTNAQPIMDESQDYKLLDFDKRGDSIMVKFSRKLTLCNKHDRPITPDTQRIIWAYGDGKYGYHGGKRGTHSVLLVDYADKKETQVIDKNTTTIDLLMTEETLSTDKTTYMCKAMRMPKLDGKRHLIRTDPIIQPGNEALVHHILLYACSGKFNSSKVNEQHKCTSDNMPNEFRRCRGGSVLVHAWAIGAGGFPYPKEAGLSFGAPGDPDILLMETHYDNPKGLAGLKDKSGLKLFLSSDLRPMDAGVLTVGHSLVPHLIPPKEKAFVSHGFCSSTCLESEEQTTQPKIFAAGLHSHLQGRKIVVRLVRDSDGTETKRITQDLTYDFNFQEAKYLQEMVELPKGHSVHVECTYNTMEYDKPVTGGESTREEMCLAFLWHYPINKGSLWCLSRPWFPLRDFATDVMGWSLDAQSRVTDELVLDGKNVKGQYSSLVMAESEEIWKNKMVKEKWQEYARLPKYIPECRGTTNSNEAVNRTRPSGSWQNYIDMSSMIQPVLSKTLPNDVCDVPTKSGSQEESSNEDNTGGGNGIKNEKRDVKTYSYASTVYNNVFLSIFTLLIYFNFK
jgi:hypothetical protein